MTVREEILAELTAEMVTKIDEEPRQGNIILLEQELAEKAAKINITEDVIKKGKKFCFLVVVSGQQKNGAVICNLTVKWGIPEDPTVTMNPSKPRTPCLIKVKARKHARSLKCFLEPKIQTVFIQAVKEPYIGALKNAILDMAGECPIK